MKDSYDSGDSENLGSAWNLSQSNILTISELLRKAIHETLMGNQEASYHTTQQVYLIIYNDLSPKDDKAQAKFEKKIQGYLLMIHRGIEVKKSISLFYYWLNRYKQNLQDLLGSNGYLIAKKEDSASLY